MVRKTFLALVTGSALIVSMSTVHAEGDEEKKPEARIILTQSDEEKKPEAQVILSQGDEEKKPDAQMSVAEGEDDKKKPEQTQFV